MPPLFFIFFPFRIGSDGYFRVTKWRLRALALAFSSVFQAERMSLPLSVGLKDAQFPGLLTTKSSEALRAPEAPSGRDRRLGPTRRGARHPARFAAAAQEVSAGQAGRAGRRWPLATRQAVCEAGPAQRPAAYSWPEEGSAGSGLRPGRRRRRQQQQGCPDPPLACLSHTSSSARPRLAPVARQRSQAVGHSRSCRAGFEVRASRAVSMTSICASLSRIAHVKFPL